MFSPITMQKLEHPDYGFDKIQNTHKTFRSLFVVSAGWLDGWIVGLFLFVRLFFLSFYFGNFGYLSNNLWFLNRS